ncbi:MAG: aconitase X catalytic domain-containing protein [Desulfobacterales bacterium]|nr:aconitase X catalytic domain-containing protein [Desulfobacterales bacterium]
MKDFNNLKISLTQQEKDVLEGKQGAMLQKIMETVVRYGEALEAERLVDITGKGHFVITHAIPGISPSMEMLDDLIEAGLKAGLPFTLDPVAPLDYDNWWLTSAQKKILDQMYQTQARYDKKMLQLGLLSPEACTCTPYLPEVGNLPKRDDILAWSESACVIFANSVLGARSNRNGAIMDLLCNIIGKVPLSGFLLNEERKATWRIEIRTDELPPPQLLGAAIGKRVLADVPYIIGLDRYLGSDMNQNTLDYLHDMGAGCATAGAVGLYHVENLTPEALEMGDGLLAGNFKTCIIDDNTLQDLLKSYPVLWKEKNARPEKCYLGCPHFSLNQLEWWAAKIHEALMAANCINLKIKTTICAAPQVLAKFRENKKAWQQLTNAGVKFSPACSMQLFDNNLSENETIITNSNKLRAYTNARYFPDKEILEILVSGNIRGDA